MLKKTDPTVHAEQFIKSASPKYKDFLILAEGTA